MELRAHVVGGDKVTLHWQIPEAAGVYVRTVSRKRHLLKAIGRSQARVQRVVGAAPTTPAPSWRFAILGLTARAAGTAGMPATII